MAVGLRGPRGVGPAGGSGADARIVPNAGLRREPVGFLGDDRGKAGTRMHDLPALGGVDRIEEVLEACQVAEVIVSSGRIPAQRLRRLEAAWGSRGVTVLRSVFRLERSPGDQPDGATLSSSR